MPILFLLLRILSGILLTCGLTVLMLIVFLHSAVNLMKEGVGVLGYVATLFGSGFTKGTAPTDPQGFMVTMPQVGLTVLFVAMIVSLFLPGSRLLLHAVAVAGAVALVWYARMLLNGPQLELLCLPAFPVWYVYYALCLFWSGSQNPVIQANPAVR